MFPFWELAIAPVIEAVGAERIVEIGALRGETTELMLNRLAADAELHVIDPLPEFDPSEHEARFAGRYIFHRDLSLNVLPDLPAVDVALIDGDHNWYTVYNELRLLAASAANADAPLPVMILHDVCWPYGRRDLYYAPEQIPKEFRQPHATLGMYRGQEKLAYLGGVNPTMHNAQLEGGPRNGVMTAIDDFVEEFPGSIRRVVIPIYYGLAILADQRLLDAKPEVAAQLDWLEGAEGRGQLLELGESLRLQTLTSQQNLYYSRAQRVERAVHRYLELLKGALLDEHYMENEIRIDHLVRSALKGNRPMPNALRDPIRQMKDKTKHMLAARRSGKLGDDRGEIIGYFPYSTMGRVRLDHLEQCLDRVREGGVEGELVECGTGRGGGGVFLRGYLSAWEMNDRRVWIADTFRSGPSIPEHLVDGEKQALEVLGGGPGLPNLRADLNNVREAFKRFDLFDNRLRFLQGEYRDTLADAPIETISLLRLGDDLDEKAGEILDVLYDRIAIGGFVVIEDFLSPAAKKSIEEFRTRRGIDDPLERVDWSGAFWRKTSDAPAPDAIESPSESTKAHAPMPPAPTRRKDLSVVVVFYNMRREAERTLHALSRAYQEGIDEVEYEVIVVENGSRKDQRLGKDFVRSFGREFRYIDMGMSATPTPVPALNRGVAASKGDNIALMIDGAHVVTPGVLHYGMLGLRTYGPAIVATQQWFVGPGQQGEVMVDGYDQEYEDRLFDQISWPRDGYRLFEIGHFIGERDWLDGLWESNCLFAPRRLLEQVGGFDESFTMPGGGFANLELYERLGSSPDVTVVTMLGEGSFHQTHGGTTTNLSGSEVRHDTLGSYSQHFKELRGRDFMGHRKRIHYVGSMFDEAARTRARRRIAPALFKTAANRGSDLPDQPAPIPQELATDFIEAYWHSLAWRETNWLGRRVPRPATDLFAYQELVSKLRPRWIIDIRAAAGGRAWFLASVCDLLDHGQVIAVERKQVPKRAEHPRITHIEGDSVDDDVVRRVHDMVGDDDAMVILGARATARKVSDEYRLYRDLIPIGGYLVVEDTIVNGHPVWPNYGNGPAEAVKGIVERRDDFVSDVEMSKYRLSFNPNGFLKRMA
jgi:cephalosporin hydroxylase/predicted O-methyltransferase YrrM